MKEAIRLRVHILNTAHPEYVDVETTASPPHEAERIATKIGVWWGRVYFPPHQIASVTILSALER